MIGRKTGYVSVLSMILVVFLASSVYAADTIKLKVATHIASNVEEQVALMKGFEKLHPGVEIEVVHAQWSSYHDVMMTQIVGGVGPDVLSVGRYQLVSFVESGVFQPIDPFLKKDKDLNRDKDLIAGFLESGTYKGELYGLPVYNGPSLLFYVPETFARRGVPEPVQYVDQNNWNWDTLVDVAKKTTWDDNGDGALDHFGYNGFNTHTPGWAVYVANAGGRVFSPDGRVTLNSPETIRGLEFLNNLNVLHGVSQYPGPETGHWGMKVMWQTGATIERNNGREIEPTLVPAGPAGYAAIAGGVPVGISATTKHAELAYEYIKWLTTESGLWRLRGGFPLDWRTARSEEFRKSLGSFNRSDMFEKALSVPTAPEPGVGIVADYVEMNNILNNTMVMPIYRQETSVRAAVEEAHRQLEILVAK